MRRVNSADFVAKSRQARNLAEAVAAELARVLGNLGQENMRYAMRLINGLSQDKWGSIGARSTAGWYLAKQVADGVPPDRLAPAIAHFYVKNIRAALQILSTADWGQPMEHRVGNVPANLRDGLIRSKQSADVLRPIYTGIRYNTYTFRGQKYQSQFGSTTSGSPAEASKAAQDRDVLYKGFVIPLMALRGGDVSLGRVASGIMQFEASGVASAQGVLNFLSSLAQELELIAQAPPARVARRALRVAPAPRKKSRGRQGPSRLGGLRQNRKRQRKGAGFFRDVFRPAVGDFARRGARYLGQVARETGRDVIGRVRRDLRAALD